MKTVPLTKKGIELAVAIDGKPTEYKVEGDARLRVYSTPHSTTLGVKLNAFNKRFHKRLGRYPEVSLTQFKQMAEAYIQDINLSYGLLGSNISVTQLFDTHYKPRIQARKSTYKEDISKFDRVIRHEIGSLSLKEVRSYHLERVLDKLRSKGVKPATINRYRSLMHALFKYAHQNGLINYNPCSVIQRERENNIIERYLSEAEGVAFINACLLEMNNPGVQALMFSYFTGLRIKNARTLRREHLADDLSSITLLTKSGKNQTFPLSVFAQEVIKHALSMSGGEYVFPSPLNPLNPVSYPRAVMQRICKRAGIAVKGIEVEVQPGFSRKPVSIHSLRKTFSNRIMAETGSIYACCELLGHSSVEVTRRYLSISQEEQQAVVNAAFSAHSV
ncbi:MAG: tyrosine-type recombinase/integrase [Marinospirillum sp.]|uniref:tyrosine-type recombinase/integrase n=1 Tax=Marinospirillum sp. TaxID=2183934 RepID=UPI0019E36301|nr:tyrosine-type recombinase/integrase [Marinospirillum sp.]MBE0507523.1 tyrosine-type recombinase/integrase [Marinospirillum sp.]